MTYLDIVNKVLEKLRENTVTTVNENPYSALIGTFVNDVLHDVQNMGWDWDALRGTLTITTSESLFNYVLAGAGNSFRVLNIFNDTTNQPMHYRPSNWFDKALLQVPITKAAPLYFTHNGVDEDGDGQLDIFPVPDGVYEIRVNGVFPIAPLVKDTDSINLYPNMIYMGALSRAISERGEDGGNTDSEIRWENLVSNLIAIEANRREDEITWQAV